MEDTTKKTMVDEAVNETIARYDAWENQTIKFIEKNLDTPSFRQEIGKVGSVSVQLNGDSGKVSTVEFKISLSFSFYSKALLLVRKYTTGFVRIMKVVVPILVPLAIDLGEDLAAITKEMELEFNGNKNPDEQAVN